MRGHIETSGQGRWLGLTTNYEDGGYRWMDGSRMKDPPFLGIKKNTNSPITSTYHYYIEMEESGLRKPVEELDFFSGKRPCGLTSDISP